MPGELAGRLLGLPGFAVLTVADYGGEIEMMIETTESVAGRPVSELLRKRILDPLGLSATRLPATATAAGGLVSYDGAADRYEMGPSGQLRRRSDDVVGRRSAAGCRLGFVRLAV